MNSKAAIYGHRSAMRTELAIRFTSPSFMDTRIVAIGIALSYCWESPKPQEFGTAGQNWKDIGWRVRVRFTELLHKLRPNEHVELLRPALPAKYSPLQQTRLEQHIEKDVTIPETDRTAIVCARRGQGLFRDRVAQI